MSHLNKKGLEYNPKTGRFSPKGDQSRGRMVCYNCGEKGHISPKCSKPKKHQEKSKNKGKEPFGKKKNFKSRGRAYVGEWLSSNNEDEDEQEEEEGDSSDEEEVAGIAITCESPLPPPPMCFMAKGGAKKKKKQDPRKGTWDEATDSESEEEEVVSKKGNKKKEVLREELINSDSEGDDEEVTVESLLPKLNCVMKQLLKEHAKVKNLTRDNNELMKGLEEYDESYEELRTKYDNLVNDHDNLVSRHEKLSIEHEELKVSLKELECCLNEKVPSNIPSSNDGVPNVAKVDASTSCQDLLDMPCPSPCDDISMLETNLLKENEKLKVDNAKLLEGWKKYTKGYEKFGEMMIHQALSGEYKGFSEAIKKHKVEKPKKPLKAPQEKKIQTCLECGKPGHVSWQCSYVAPPSKPHTWSIHNNTNYVVYKNQEGHPKVKFLGPKNKNHPKMIWVPKILVEKAFPSGIAMAPTKTVWVPKLKA